MAVLRRKEYHVESNGIGGNSFTVKASSKMFETLMSTLYRHKEEATARELACNANDAHKERNRKYRPLVNGYHQSVYAASFRASERPDLTWFAPPEKPWELHTPSTIEPYLEIKDYGVGLTVDQIMGLEWWEYVGGDGVPFQMDDEWPGELDSQGNPIGAERLLDDEGRAMRSGGMYTTLFDSTKENDNDQTGAFGLGSKSPFSIADSFTVESRVNGERHMYLMYMNSKRIPQVDWITKDSKGFPAPLPTEEFNGVTVKVTVQADAFYTMRNACEKILRVFEHQPAIKGYPIDVTPISRDKLIGQTYMQPHSNTHYAVTGDVAYPIELDKLDPDIRAVFKKLRRGSYTFFPLGELNVPPSREDLSYDEFTMEALNRRLAYAVEAVEETIAHEFKDQKTLYDMMTTYNSLIDVWGSDLLKSIRYGGKNGKSMHMAKDMKIEVPKYKSGDTELSMFHVTAYDLQLDRLVKHEYDKTEIPVSHFRNSIILFLDNKRMYLKKAMHIAKELEDEEGRGTAHIYMVTPKPGVEVSKGVPVDAKFVSAAFEHEIPVFVSSKVTPPKPKYGSSSSSGMSRYTHGTSCSFHSWEKITPEVLNEDILLDDKPWLVVPMVGFNPQGVSMGQMKYHKAFFKEHGDMYRGIIGYRKTAEKVISENPDMFFQLEGRKEAFMKEKLGEFTAKEKRYIEAQMTCMWYDDDDIHNLGSWLMVYHPERLKELRIFTAKGRSGYKFPYYGTACEHLTKQIKDNGCDSAKDKWRLMQEYSSMPPKRLFPWAYRIINHFTGLEQLIVDKCPAVFKHNRPFRNSDIRRTLDDIHMYEFKLKHGYKRGGSWVHMPDPEVEENTLEGVCSSRVNDYLEGLREEHGVEPEVPPLPEGTVIVEPDEVAQ
ncbi:histidine kinase-like ATPase [Vibrio phage 1.244.A._10N.261.54.C3]|nr:histidine kinase-like ATPase [Vibrio phage 1.244.A._10N.261.54.C3]AUR98795.1 histidine kinase-like ATPase [Vibrio phage 1.255.O._10N.286.45.F1]